MRVVTTLRDWPSTSLRTRIFESIAVALVVAQSSIAIFLADGETAALGKALGIMVMLVSLAMILWAVMHLRGELAPNRWAGILIIAGATARAVGLLPLSYGPSVRTDGLLTSGQSLVVAVSYVLLVAGFLWIALSYRGRIKGISPLVFSSAAALTVGTMFAVGAFAPLPAMPTVLTARDIFAALLLAGDVTLLGLASFVAVANLQLAGGVMSRPWLWIAVGELVIAMGDAVHPLLAANDAVIFTPILWGLGYVLGAVGASLMIDTLDWHDRLPKTVRAAAEAE